MNRKHGWLVVLACSLALTGCGDQRILERLGFMHTISYDAVPHKKLRITVSIPETEPQSKSSRELLTTVANSSKEAHIQLARKTNLEMVSGQLRGALFGSSLAEKGLWDVIDTLLRDPSISPNVKISVVTGSSADGLLRTKLSQHLRTDRFIDRLLEKEIKTHLVPRTTLYDFSRDFFDDGIDPVAPLLKRQKNSITLDGIGLFRDDKYVRDSFKRGEMSLDLSKQNGGHRELVMLSSLKSQRKVKVEVAEDGKKHVKVDVKMKCSILEYIGPLKLGNDADKRKLEAKMSQYLSKKGEEMIRFMQQNRVDGLGIGKYVRNSMDYDAWRKLDWHEEFRRMNVSCNVAVKIKDTGKLN
ncbi:Ger(x)C family spore germination protein [Brevibacillus sp. B_LB10_24]|uniref:Ger(x)C family spore germination protein n=1 Tax=Brevibacillus sp. B_LB10_24 TaxID=3380645 RepID=UPI0038BCC33E